MRDITFRRLVTLWVIWVAVGLALWSLAIFAAIHFVRKLW